MLASASPRRREILAKFFEDFIVVPSGVGEESYAKTPEKHAVEVARRKAMKVAEKMGLGHTVVGADTVVVIDGEILGKPRDEDEARKMLERLSGRVHEVITGYCIVHGGKIIEGFSRTEVKFRALSHLLINWYLSTGEWRDKAGAYGIQGKGGLLVEWIRGDYYNVVGLPIEVIFKLVELGFKLRP
ncbi:Maf-like protein [Pyrococcus yayanosii CH1]|uniref:dTTP/UTP pyrophosphatase n=1 Tax=Pyrococcus yayanosii (strain CH1 / JCM 16557) TaxID=529709 RepID=F8AFK4_PYRYC|nr:Maf-like protein [Pyrococcus yayanosii CH1]